ncbi:PAS domain S-box protein [Actinoplanes sp. NPDC051861]|uniref:sensor histidine kinase n=1 Tax=Actinoplanes sp. NPDC051861 TaxID=3155170 RepID=UPI003446C27B
MQREVAAAATDRDVVLPLVAERALQALAGADAAMVGLVDGDELYAAAATGVLRAFAGSRVPVAGSLAGSVVTSGTTLHCDDTATDARVLRTNRMAASVGSMIVAPLFADGAVFGTLGVSSRQAHAFDDADIEHLTLLADALTGALRHAEAIRLEAEALQRATEANAALHDSQARFRSAFEDSPLGMVLTDLTAANLGVILRANAAMAGITGYPVTVLTGMRVHDLHHADEHPATDEALRLLLSGTTDRFTTVSRFRHADGHILWVRTHIAVIRDDHNRPRYLVTQVEDITEQRAIAQQLHQRAHLLDLTQDAVILRDLRGHIAYWNPAAERIYGWTAGAAAGHDLDHLLGTVCCGSTTRDDIDRALDEHGVWAGELEHRRADGRPVIVLARQALQRDADGQPVAVLSINTDVTARRAAEAARDAAITDLADRNSQLQDANQLKQDLIGMLGHEIGNPLCAILGYTETIAETWDDLSADTQKTMLAAIDRNAHQLDDIVREVLTMVTLDAGRLSATPESVNVHDHLRVALTNTVNSTSTAIDCPTDLTARVQPRHLAQILSNLLSNAAKYGGGATRITARATGTTVRIAVCDDGPGVPTDLREHLFERFTRAAATATTVKGTGLGLHIVRELARANNGDIHYEPAPGHGSAFVVTLPTGGA